MRPDIGAFLIAVFFVLGASFSSLHSGPMIIMIGLFAASVVFVFGRKKMDIGRLFSVILFLCFIAGSMYFHIRSSDDRLPAGGVVSGRATISDFPERRDSYQRFTVRSFSHPKEKFDVIVPLYPSFRYGDVVDLSGKVEYGKSGRSVIAFPVIDIVGKGGGSSVMGSLFDIREKMTGSLMKALPPSSSALAAGILLGDQSGFSAEMWDDFRETGTTHIVALSGFNIAVIASISAAIVSVFSRRLKFIIPVIIVILFVAMAGGEASAVRAAIMGTVLLFGKDVGRRPCMRNVIMLSALIMVLWDPGVVISDIGFELSFLAVIGIIYLAPIIKKIFRSDEEGVNSMKNIMIDTASAQIAVTPILLSRFGFVSWYSLPVNLLVTGTVPLAMALSFGAAITGLLSGDISRIVAVPADMVLQYELKTIDIFAGIF